MRKILLSMAAVSALAVGAPAVAQQYPTGAYADTNISARIDQLRLQIQSGVQAGTINRTEARTLRERLRQISQLERQYRYNGITRQERADLQQRIRDLRQQIRYASGGQRGYGASDNRCAVGQDWIDRNRDGYDDRDTDRDGRWDDNVRCDDDYDDDDGWRNGNRSGDWVDRNRDGWDDRDIDRDGRRDDDDYDDRYEDNRRGGLGGIIDSVLGRDELRVGQRVSGNLGPVPYEYRSRFRDGNGVYYGSDGRRIYQVDARTNVVLRIYTIGR